MVFKAIMNLYKKQMYIDKKGNSISEHYNIERLLR
jgi:hypothetical protein